MTNRRRCVECGRRYRPAASAVDHQCVCGPECRRARRRKQAKQRRAKDLQHFHDEERRRQQESRQRRRGETPAQAPRAGPEPTGRDVTACHAPASSRKDSELHAKLAHLWDRQVELSRASLDRELGQMGRKFRRFVSEALGEAGT